VALTVRDSTCARMWSPGLAAFDGELDLVAQLGHPVGIAPEDDVPMPDRRLHGPVGVETRSAQGHGYLRSRPQRFPPLVVPKSRTWFAQRHALLIHRPWLEPRMRFSTPTGSWLGKFLFRRAIGFSDITGKQLGSRTASVGGRSQWIHRAPHEARRRFGCFIHQLGSEAGKRAG